MTCEDFAEIIALDAFGEAGDDQRHALALHAAACRSCAARAGELAGLQRLLLNERPVAPDAASLARYRVRLSAALDELPSRSRAGRLLDGLRATLLPALPRLSLGLAPLLLALAFSAGWLVRGHYAFGAGQLVDADLLGSPAPLHVHSIEHDPATGRIEISYDAMRRGTVVGGADDARIQRMLIAAVEEPPNPGLQLDSMDLLETRAGELQVQKALLWALQHDENAGVRLKALEALRSEVGSSADVRQALAASVLRDANPGVRAEAISALTQASAADAASLLIQIAHSSSDPFVRLRCAAAMQQLQGAIPAGLLEPSSAPNGTGNQPQ
jgi:hypothetical protein